MNTERLPEVKRALRVTKKGNNWELCNELFGPDNKIDLKYIARTPSYWKDSNQYALGISIPKDVNDDEVNDICKEIEAITPFLKTVRYNIWEFTHSEFANYNLEYNCKKWQIIRWEYYEKHVDYECRELKYIIEYISCNHYWPEPEDE